ncbi:hypothetical protein ACIRRA_45455 [Nocardia sp. NPDC101769]|uniref:hypothetical protein n=1 Tax=Nocardia sp. NPDC101769 TaxID=3364333 RepID=UPI00381350B0
MLTASLHPAACTKKLRRINIQLLRQPAHRHRQCGGNPSDSGAALRAPISAPTHGAAKARLNGDQAMLGRDDLG